MGYPWEIDKHTHMYMYMYMYIIYIGNKYEIKTWEHIGKIHPNINGDSIESWTNHGDKSQCESTRESCSSLIGCFNPKHSPGQGMMQNKTLWHLLAQLEAARKLDINQMVQQKSASLLHSRKDDLTPSLLP